MHASASMNSCIDMSPARTMSSNFHTWVPEPICWSRNRPLSIGPPETTRAGRSQLAAPMSRAGVVLSQPTSSTTPSSGWARMDSSTSMLTRLRYSIVNAAAPMSRMTDGENMINWSRPVGEVAQPTTPRAATRRTAVRIDRTTCPSCVRVRDGWPTARQGRACGERYVIIFNCAGAGKPTAPCRADPLPLHPPRAEAHRRRRSPKTAPWPPGPSSRE